MVYDNELRKAVGEQFSEAEERKTYFNRLFRRAGYKDLKKPAAEHEIIKKGMRRFKRRTMGFCLNKGTKTLEELSNILVDIGIAIDIDEAKTIVPEMVAQYEKSKGSPLFRGPEYSTATFMWMERVENPNNREPVYKISLYTPLEYHM